MCGDHVLPGPVPEIPVRDIATLFRVFYDFATPERDKDA